nr:ORF40t [Ipomoea batatas]
MQALSGMIGRKASVGGFLSPPSNPRAQPWTGGGNYQAGVRCHVEFGTLNRLPVISRRKVRMTSSHHAPYALGDTRATMAGTKGRDPARVS